MSAESVVSRELPGWEVRADHAGMVAVQVVTGLAVTGATPEQVVSRARYLIRLQEVARVVLSAGPGPALLSDDHRWPQVRRYLERVAWGEPDQPPGAPHVAAGAAHGAVPPSTPPQEPGRPIGHPGARSADPRLTGELCGVCGQPEIVRESSCRTRCRACGALDGGCG